MRENWKHLSNKSMVAIKASLFVALLIGLVVFSTSTLSVHAEETLCIGDGCTTTTTTTIPECFTDEDCGKCLGWDKDDCGYDGDWNTLDHLLPGSKIACIDGHCVDQCDYSHFCADGDLYDSVTAACNAECDEHSDCPDYCTDDVFYTGSCDLYPGDCACDYETEDCNSHDGCYAYSTGCEERDYYCTVEGCDFTYSNRNTDYKEDWVYYCSDSELRRHKKSHDFYCDGDVCKDHTSWTNDELVKDCYYYDEYCDGDELWYEEGYCNPSGPVCDKKTGLVKDCYYYTEYCDGDKRMSDTGFCNDMKDSCDNTVSKIEDCSDNNYEDCKDTYYKHYYTESCSETDGETQCLPASSLIDCRDEYWCDGQEYCVDNDGVHCEDGTPVDCDDEDECTYDNCIEDGYNTGHCENPHKDEYPPETDKWYEGPYKFGSGPEEWITSATEVWMSAEDKGPDGLPQCIVGVDKIWYKDVYLPEEEDWHYCYEDCGEWTPNDYEDEGWVEYLEPFFKSPDSCHIIEFYSEDLLGNKEEIDWQCVFVDNTPPVITKTIGDPKAECEGIECEDWEWKITISTPINLECEDLGDHPVDEVEMKYRTFWDGELVKNWTKHMGETIYFTETCLHRLEVCCVDALGNEVCDDETFKVVDKEFTITLNKKWNLVSVPILLLDDDVEDVLEDIEENVEIVWAYDADKDEWYVYTPDGEENDNLEEMLPGWGYWIKMSQADTLLLGGESWGMPPSPPSPQRNLVEGWNLIGYYGTDGLTSFNGPFGNGDYAACVLNSLLDLTNIPQWTKILTYWEPYNPNQWVDTSNMCDKLDPGAGYWIFMKSDQLYGPGECTSPLCT